MLSLIGRMDLSERLLPLCEYHMKIMETIELFSEHKYGYCAHAFGAALRDMMKDFHVLVAQLEHQNRIGKLTLQVMRCTMYCYVLEVMVLLSTVSIIITSAVAIVLRGAEGERSWR